MVAYAQKPNYRLTVDNIQIHFYSWVKAIKKKIQLG